MSGSSRPRVWQAPIFLGVIAACGLTSALLSDGVGDYLAWIALAIPVAVVLWYAPPRRKRKHGSLAGAERDQAMRDAETIEGLVEGSVEHPQGLGR